MFQHGVADILAFVHHDVRILPARIVKVRSKIFFKKLIDLLNRQRIIMQDFFRQGTHVMHRDQRIQFLGTQMLQ